MGMTIVIAAIFAIICFGVAITGFSSLGNITDPVELGNAKGYAGFWAFLGTIAVAFGGLSWWLLRSRKDGDA